MATPAENLAKSLAELKKLQDKGIVAIKSGNLSRTHQTRLLQTGFLKEVTKGWYIATPAEEEPGDSTSWYAAYWPFCAGFLNEKYGDDYFISPDHSLPIHAGNWTVPQQLIIRTVAGTNYSTPLPFGNSLWHWSSPTPKAASFIRLNGIRMMTAAASILYCSASLFQHHASDMRVALSMIRDASEITGMLLQEGHSVIAGRLAGAFRNIGRNKIADDILNTMRAAGYIVNEKDPFETSTKTALPAAGTSPYVNRIKMMWYEMRDGVINNFPEAPGLPADKEKYLQEVDEIYVTDAYHSLSIERYIVTPELIERVRQGTWDHHNSASDRQQRDAMAARGYWQASRRVRESIVHVLEGQNAGDVADIEHREWYRQLFAPSVVAGIINAADLAGYRNQQVYIGRSRHVPLNNDAVLDTMPALFELLKAEPDAGVRAVLGHFIFVYIHPYIDGNGRMGRFLMNLMLASGGYPWTVIPLQKRNSYMESLEQASTTGNIEPFAKFIAHLVKQTMQGKPEAGI